MTRSRKLTLVLAGVTALLATGLGSIPSSQATISPAASSAIAALQAKRAQLVSELAAMQPRLGVAGGAAGSAEAAFNTQQTKVLAERNQLDQLNAQLLSLSGQLTSNQTTAKQDKQNLSEITRATYETSGRSQVLAAVLSSQSFGQAMDRLKAANQVSSQVEQLVSRLAAADASINAEQAAIRRDVTRAAGLEGQLAAESDQLLTILVNRNLLFQHLSGPARQIASEIANIDNQIAYLEAGPHVGASPCGNHFAYGYCTYYVATRRCVPWLGNARDWYSAAAAMGFKEGNQPIAGAVVVFWPGVNGVSTLGHVAYVEAVGPAAGIPAGSFKLSEMNYNAWNSVDYRILPDNSSTVEGFIYGQ